MSEVNWKTETRKLADLKPLENNPRTITKEAIDKLITDLDDVGEFKPLIIDIDGTILGGNMRYEVKKRKGDIDTLVSIPSRKLTEEERKKIVLLDNTHRGEFDIDILANEFQEMLEELEIDEIQLPQDFNPEEENSDERLDKPKYYKCPNCGEEFTS
jgi:site-specific DNA-methyltransferase (adenine-specific)